MTSSARDLDSQAITALAVRLYSTRGYDTPSDCLLALAIDAAAARADLGSYGDADGSDWDAALQDTLTDIAENLDETPRGEPDPGPCGEDCDATGTVAWPATLPAEGPHASYLVCGDPRHVAAAAESVERLTGHRGEYTPLQLAARR